MRRPYLGFAAALALAVLWPAGRASAQVAATGTGLGGVGADPFSFYYGYYLPHAAYMAAQPTPMDTLNQITAVRQSTAQTDRAALYDPISPYGGEDEADPFRPYSSRRGGDRGAPRVGRFDASNTRGNGPALYYGRTAQYFPGLKAGRGPNRNIAHTRLGRGLGTMPAVGGGGMGMPGMGGGMSMPGPR